MHVSHNKSNATNLRSSTKVTIDPKDFTGEQWRDLYYATSDIPSPSGFVPTDDHSDAMPFKATRKATELAAKACRTKADSVRAGDYGESDEDEEIDIEDWGDVLDETAGILEGYLGGLEGIS